MSHDDALEALVGDGPPSASRLLTAFGSARLAERELREAARAYEEDRRALFLKALEERGQAWCSMRHHAVSENETRLVIESGMHTSINRACKDCLISALLGQRSMKPVWRGVDGEFYDFHDGTKVYVGYASDWSDPPGVPHHAVQELGLPPKVEIVLSEETGYDVRVGYDETRDRYRQLR